MAPDANPSRTSTNSSASPHSPEPQGRGGGYHEDRYVSSFIVGAPFDTPRLVILCVIEDLDKRVGPYYGGLSPALSSGTSWTMHWPTWVSCPIWTPPSRGRTDQAAISTAGMPSIVMPSAEMEHCEVEVHRRARDAPSPLRAGPRSKTARGSSGPNPEYRSRPDTVCPPSPSPSVDGSPPRDAPSRQGLLNKSDQHTTAGSEVHGLQRRREPHVRA